MDIILVLLCTALVLCVLGLIYLFAWVRPRIDRIYKVQTQINDLVFEDKKRWMYKKRMCNRDTRNLEYTLRPINMRAILSEVEIEELHTID